MFFTSKFYFAFFSVLSETHLHFSVVSVSGLEELLQKHRLAHFTSRFRELEVTTIAALRDCSDSFLVDKVGLKDVHLRKLRRAIADYLDKVAMGLFEAPDGFRGTFEEVLAHEIKIGLHAG